MLLKTNHFLRLLTIPVSMLSGFLMIIASANAQMPNGAVFSDATPKPPGGGSYNKDVFVTAQCITASDSEDYNAAADDGFTAYNDDASTMPAFYNEESGSISQSYAGPRPGDTQPGLLKQIVIQISHQAVDNIEDIDVRQLVNQVFLNPPSAVTTAVSSHTTTISNESSPTASLNGKILTIKFSSSVSERKVGFVRNPNLRLVSDYLVVDINTAPSDEASPVSNLGLVAYDPRTGYIVAQDSGYANPNRTDAGTVEFTYNVALPDVHKVNFGVTSNSNLFSSFWDAPEVINIGPGDHMKQLPSFNWSVAFELNN